MTIRQLSAIIALLCLAALAAAIGLVALALGTPVGPRVPRAMTEAIQTAALPATPTIDILAFGDMMLDRNVRGMIDRYGAEYPFLKIEGMLAGHDVVVANAEGPFTSNPSKTLGVKNGPLIFTFDPAVLPTLRRIGFTLFSQANNHAYNFGADGLAQSEASIAAAGIGWFGDPLNKDVAPYVAEADGVKAAFVGYHEFVPGGDGTILDAIRLAKQDGDFVVVYPHWGVEYSTSTDPTQVTLAHAFIDAGADAVLGSHPHVIEPLEIYKGKAIFYSMGNFIFDQNPDGPTGRGLSIELKITPDAAAYTLFPLAIRQEQASLMPADARAAALSDLALHSIGTTQDEKAAIKAGGLSLGR